MYKKQFEEDGFLSNIPILNTDETQLLCKNVIETIDKYDILNNEYRCKSNILFKWIDELTRHPNILKIVKEILGEDVLCLDTMFWGKKPNTEHYVSFHQDGYYWNIKKPIDAMIVWLPFQDTDSINGTIHYLKGSHIDFVKHDDIKDENNLLRRGQTINISDISLPVIACDTKLGEATFHHPYNIHGSYPNKGSDLRLAIHIQYIRSDCITRINNYTEHAMLISGTNHSDIRCVSRPTDDFDQNKKTWYIAWFNQRQNYLLLKDR